MGGPQIAVVEDADELGRAGADVVADAIAATPARVGVVATGERPMGLYAELAARRRAGRSTRAITAVQLDEYLGLKPGDRRSLFGWMRRSFLEPLGIADERAMRLPLDGDLAPSCAAFDRTLEARGPLDLAILGLGTNGHLGFNEPPVRPGGPRHVRSTLSTATIDANARYWERVGRAGTSGDVRDGPAALGARRSCWSCPGGQSTIVHRALEGAAGPDVPGFVPAAGRPETCTVVVDRAAWGEARDGAFDLLVVGRPRST